MAELHAALTNLSPLPFTDIPLDELPAFMRTHFAAGELITNSVPPPPHATAPFSTATPHHTRPNRARSAKEMHVSSVAPSTVAPEHEELRSAWGKPMKFAAAQNPHGVALYKMAGKDRHGAWFARRSVHEGLGFERFCRAMKREFPHSLAVKGGPGAGAVRGLAAEVRLEEKVVEGLGKFEVYQLSGQMPKPVTPREFLQVVMTTEEGLSEKSGVEDAEGGGKKHVPRSYMIVSRPTTHEGAPERSGFVRGQYESVELIREVPLHRRHGASKSTSDLLGQDRKSGEHGRSRGATVGFAESRGPDAKGEQRDLGKAPDDAREDDPADPELNPVEWIMITRSDPGGGIPRFLVDRGTPDAMLGDVTKFLDWACKIDELPEDEPEQHQDEVAAPPKRAETVPEGAEMANGRPEKEPRPPARSASEPVQAEEGGIVDSIANTLEAYAPPAVSATIHDYIHPAHPPINGADTSEDEDDASDTSSSASWCSANSRRRASIAEGAAHTDQQPTDFADQNAPSVASSESLVTSTVPARPGSASSKHDKELQKLIREREKLDRKLAKKRAEEEAKITKLKEKEAAGEEKAAEKHKREISKAEEKHQKELKKLEEKERKERERAETRRRKQEEKQKLSFVSRERDELRGQLDHSRKENELLLERIEELQRENTAMADKLGKLGGDGLLVDMRKSLEGGRGRAGSAKSAGSGEKKSLDGKAS